MRKHYLLICLSLLISLFIYLFYRTGKTVVNELFIRVISIDVYTDLKAHILHALPLNDIIIYSLPEALWVFCITLTSIPYYIKWHKWYIDCKFIPLIFCISLEMLQYFHITNGRFDFMDIGLSVMFWLIANYAFGSTSLKQNLFTRPNSTTLICLASYCIVYLAHVVK